VPCPSTRNPNRRCLRLTAAQVNQFYLAANGLSPGINQQAIAYLADVARRYPVNDTTEGDGLNTGGFRFNARTPTRNNTAIAKFDFSLTNKQTVFVRGHHQQDLVSLVPDFPDLPTPSIWNHPKGLAVNHTWVPSNRFVNRFTYGYTRAAFTRLGDSDQTDVNFRFIFDRTPTRALTRVTPVHNFVNDVSFVKGNHSLQFGGNVRLIRNGRSSFANAHDFVSTNPSGYDQSGAVLVESSAGAPIFPKVAEALIGGWTLTGIFRWNSGFPVIGAGADRPFALRRWATNWQVSSGMVRVRPVTSAPAKNVNGEPNLFRDPQAAFLSYRDPQPGEGGDRNVLRNPGYFSLDLGLYKTFKLPWENHNLTFRWEVYNLTNTQRFTLPSGEGFGLPTDPFLLGGTPPESFGKFTATQTPLNENKAGRVMQFALRHTF
jgi:hypothetical protein